MRKKLIIILICIAIPVYIYNAWLITGGFFRGGPEIAEDGSKKPIKTELSLPSMRIVRFTEKGKSPFVPYKVKPKPVVSKRTVKPKVRKPKTEAKPPKIKITGIMWNPSNPMAMVTLPDGTSTVAKAGQTLAGSIEVKKIEKNGIKIVYKGNSFWIKK